MNILIVSPYLPHPKIGHGGGVYIYDLIDHLCRRHTVTLVSFCDEQEEALAKELGRLPLTTFFLPRRKGAQTDRLGTFALACSRAAQFFMSILRWEPYYVSKWRDRRLFRLVRDLAAKQHFDVVQIEYAQLGYLHNAVPDRNTLLQEIDVTFRPAYRRFKSATSPLRKAIQYIEWCRWARYERRLVPRIGRMLTVTDQDRMLLAWLSRKENITYVSLPTDAAKSLPAYSTREPNSLVFVGSYLHGPNVDAAIWLCESIFPQIRSRVPDAKLYLIGQSPSPSVHAAAKQCGGVEVLGFVDDVNGYLRRFSVFIAPLRKGGGVKTKVLSAFAQGIPIVSTKVGTEGIDGIQNDNVMLGDSADRLAGHVVKLFSDPALAASYGTNGWNLVQQWYSWEAALTKLEGIYLEVGS